eukprot:jgi/Psemu1/26065/gm1.26065_g
MPRPRGRMNGNANANANDANGNGNLKELSKGFVSSVSLLSLDETVSNSSLASSASASNFSSTSGFVSLSSGFSSVHECNNNGFGFSPSGPPQSVSIAIPSSPLQFRAEAEAETETESKPEVLQLESQPSNLQSSHSSLQLQLQSHSQLVVNTDTNTNTNTRAIQDRSYKSDPGTLRHGFGFGYSLPAIPRRILSPRNFNNNRNRLVWEEAEDDIFILLDGNLDTLNACREFYVRGTSLGLTPRRSRELATSLGVLSKPYSYSSASASASASCHYCHYCCCLSSVLSCHGLAEHDGHVATVASVLSTERHTRALKLAVAGALCKMCRRQPKGGNDDDDDDRNAIDTGTDTETDTDPSERSDGSGGEPAGGAASASAIVEQLLEFLTDRTRDWVDGLASPAILPLACELRARCLRDSEQERERIRSVADAGDTAAVVIATGAKLVESGIRKSNRFLEGTIDTAGRAAKGWIDEGRGSSNTNGHNHRGDKHKHNAFDPREAAASASGDANAGRGDHRDAVAVRALSGSVRRASEYAKQGSKLAAESTLDATLSGLYRLGNTLDETTLVSPEHRERIRAAGTVGAASVGAVALVADAFAQSGRSVGSRAAGVAAETIGHVYGSGCGSVAGDVARDASAAYDNILQTVSNLALLGNTRKLAKKAANTAGKHRVDGDAERARTVLLELERRGALVAKHTLGIRWVEGSLTKELLAAAASEASNEEDDDDIDNDVDDKNGSGDSPRHSPEGG